MFLKDKKFIFVFWILFFGFAIPFLTMAEEIKSEKMNNNESEIKNDSYVCHYDSQLKNRFFQEAVCKMEKTWNITETKWKNWMERENISGKIKEACEKAFGFWKILSGKTPLPTLKPESKN